MIKPIQLACASFLLVSSNTVFAGTIVQIQNKNDLATITTDGKLARMNMSGNEYVIVDYKKRTVKMVSPQKRQVMLLNTDKISTGKSMTAVRTSVKKRGQGMKVAGYATQKYAYFANGKSCGVIYGSKEVYQQHGMKELFQALKIMLEKQSAVLGDLAGMVDDCMLAEMKVIDHVNTIGVPMLTEKQNGVVDSEVKSIQLGVELPADTFVIPASYKTITLQQQIREMKQKVQQYQPQMQQIMQQMQQSGQTSPEMTEQMRRVQGMMKQN